MTQAEKAYILAVSAGKLRDSSDNKRSYIRKFDEVGRQIMSTAKKKGGTKNEFDWLEK